MSITVIRGIVPVVATVDRRTWGILRGRRSAKSLWILPELVEIAENAFPTSSLDAHASTGSTGLLSVFDREQKKTVR
jgi:hypothetical protein